MIKKFLKTLAVVFIVAFVVGAAAIYLWNLVVDGKGVLDWGLTLVLAITISIAVALARVRKT
jgi:hypothetical protein